MLLIVGKDGVERKYSCMTCIKGHRSSKCKHPQRQLHEIKPKGRPVSQCQNCRELRKRKRVHIKCSCKNRDEGSASPSIPMATTPGESPSTAADSAQNESSKESNTSTELMHEHGDMLLKQCPRCERSQGACICTYNSNMRKAQEHDNVSSGSSDGTRTPSSTSSLDTSPSTSSYNNILPPLRLSHSQRHPPIPIHDPTDDINSDTPLYKPDLAPDREAVLGHLSHRSSEDLMKEIYSNFMDPPEKRRRCDDSPGESHSQQPNDHDDDGGHFEQEIDPL